MVFYNGPLALVVSAMFFVTWEVACSWWFWCSCNRNFKKFYVNKMTFESLKDIWYQTVGITCTLIPKLHSSFYVLIGTYYDFINIIIFILAITIIKINNRYKLRLMFFFFFWIIIIWITVWCMKILVGQEYNKIHFRGNWVSSWGHL